MLARSNSSAATNVIVTVKASTGRSFASAIRMTGADRTASVWSLSHGAFLPAWCRERRGTEPCGPV